MRRTAKTLFPWIAVLQSTHDMRRAASTEITVVIAATTRELTHALANAGVPKTSRTCGKHPYQGKHNRQQEEEEERYLEESHAF